MHFDGSSSIVLQPISVELPLKEQDLQNFQLKAIPSEQISHTLRKIVAIQETFHCAVVLRGVMFLMVFVLCLYCCLLVSLFTFFNPIIAVMLIMFLYKYVIQSLSLLRKFRWHKNITLIEKWLQLQNRRLYSRKLIRWSCQDYDGLYKVAVHNLRLDN